MVARYNHFSLSRDTTSHVKMYSQFIQMFNLQFPLLECEKALRVTWLHSSSFLRGNQNELFISGHSELRTAGQPFYEATKNNIKLSSRIIAVCSVQCARVKL